VTGDTPAGGRCIIVTFTVSRAQFGVLIALLEACRETPDHPLHDEWGPLHEVVTPQAEDQD
jgi:hypothetical protein